MRQTSPLALAAGLLVIAASFDARAQAPQKPNFLVILADDMGFSDVGCFGGEIQTPNLDRLAAGGLRFTNFYNTSRCWPTRSVLMSGYYAQQLRADPPRGRHPQWARLAPHYLKPQGYNCYHSGKWHVPGAPRVVADGGFDHSYITNDHDRNFDPRNHAEDDQKLPAVQGVDGSYYSSTAIANYAIKYLKEHGEKNAGRPFFAYVAFIVPHFPLHAPAADIAKYKDKYLAGWDAVRTARLERLQSKGIVNCGLSQRQPQVIPNWNLKEDVLKTRIGAGESGHAVAWNELSDEQKKFQATKMAIHAAMVDRMDQEIGRIIEQVKAMGQLDNTVILFASDNGASAEQIIRGEGHDPAVAPGSARSFLCLGPGWSMAANTPFKLHKHWVHEGGCATPLIVHWPAGIKARGELRHDMGHVVDVVPTMLDLAGVKWSADWNGVTAPPLSGKSLAPAFAKDGAVSRDFLFFEHTGNRALRMGNWKVVSRTPENAWELYDLSTDRCENQDLARQQPQRVQEMVKKWTQLEAEYRQQAGPAPEPTTKPRNKNLRKD